MATDARFERLVAEGEAFAMTGWDWGAFAGRYVEAPPPWDYREAVRARLPGARSLLDMGTGGGELLSELAPLPPETWATEGYAPNLPVAQARLAPLGVRVVAVGADDRLPLADGRFDLVINRHESFDAAEVRRVLRPGGVFVTQQVGGRDNWELNEALQEQVAMSYEEWDAAHVAGLLRGAGLEVLEQREAVTAGRFLDIGAVVMYLGVTPWQVPGFSVATHRGRLLALHRRVQAEGGLATGVHRLLVVARRGGG